MWSIIRWFTRTADLALVTSHAMKVRERGSVSRVHRRLVWVLAKHSVRPMGAHVG